MNLNQSQIQYINERCAADRRVLNGMDLIDKIRSTQYGQNALDKAKQRTQTRFDRYMIDVVGSRAVKNTEIPNHIRYRLMIERYFDKYIFQLTVYDIVNVLKCFGFDERQTRMDLFNALLNPGFDLNDDEMLSENDMDDIILAISVYLYAIFNGVVIGINYDRYANIHPYTINYCMRFHII